jgi:hypothetical protein
MNKKYSLDELEQVDQNNPVTRGSTCLVIKKNKVNLPDDDQIYKEAYGHATFAPSFIAGAQWMRDVIMKNKYNE